MYKTLMIIVVFLCCTAFQWIHVGVNGKTTKYKAVLIYKCDIFQAVIQWQYSKVTFRLPEHIKRRQIRPLIIKLRKTEKHNAIINLPCELTSI